MEKHAEMYSELQQTIERIRKLEEDLAELKASHQEQAVRIQSLSEEIEHHLQRQHELEEIISKLKKKSSNQNYVIYILLALILLTAWIFLGDRYSLPGQTYRTVIKATI